MKKTGIKLKLGMNQPIILALIVNGEDVPYQEPPLGRESDKKKKNYFSKDSKSLG